jgi:hypothetical protein
MLSESSYGRIWRHARENALTSARRAHRSPPGRMTCGTAVSRWSAEEHQNLPQCHSMPNIPVAGQRTGPTAYGADPDGQARCVPARDVFGPRHDEGDGSAFHEDGIRDQHWRGRGPRWKFARSEGQGTGAKSCARPAEAR